MPSFTTPWETPLDDVSEAENDISEPSAPSLDSLPSPSSEPPQIAEVITRSGRHVRRNPRYFNDLHAKSDFLQTFSPEVNPVDAKKLLQPNNQVKPHPFAFISESVIGTAMSYDTYTMTLDEAMAAPNKKEFTQAMHKELHDRVNRRHWKVVPTVSIPSHKRAIPVVWSMKRKRDPRGDITKRKARLCSGGHWSIESVDYWSTYSPVVSWSTVLLMLVFAMINNWRMCSINFVMAYPQAPINTDIFMRPPKVPTNFCIPDLP